jgi:translation initiation factor 6
MHVVNLIAAAFRFENTNEVGVFAKLTNKYALVCQGASENFYAAFESELSDHIPVVHASIAGCRFVGRVTAGMQCLATCGLQGVVAHQ